MKTILCTTPIDHLDGLSIQLKKIGKLIYRPNINQKNLKNLLLKNKKVDFIFCNPNRQGYILNKKILQNSSIKLINTASTGTNHINLDDCKKLGIKVMSLTKDFKLLKKLPSTSELAFGLMIALLRNIPKSSRSVELKKWDYLPFMGQEINSLSLGIIGLGRLGKFMAHFGKSFGMKVYFYDPFVKSKEYNKVSLIKLFKISDVISVHTHAQKNTKNLVNKKLLKYSKNNQIIINTARGEIVNEKDIINFLKKKKIYGYGADVVKDEFGDIKKSDIIKKMKSLNVIITPHIGGMTLQGQLRAWNFAVNKFKDI
jgi:phosphoglycerate dehydrogenase-like enzyme